MQLLTWVWTNLRLVGTMAIVVVVILIAGCQVKGIKTAIKTSADDTQAALGEKLKPVSAAIAFTEKELGIDTAKDGKKTLDENGRLRRGDILWGERGSLFADINGDKKPDDVVAAVANLRLAVYGGQDGNGNTVTGLAALTALANSDLNGDGQPDDIIATLTALVADKAARDEAAQKAEEERAAAAQKKEEQRQAWIAKDNKAVKDELAKIRELNPLFPYNGKTDAEVDALLKDNKYDFEKAVHEMYAALTAPKAEPAIPADAAPVAAASADDLAAVDAKATALINATWALSQKPKCFEPSCSKRMKNEAREYLEPYVNK